MVTATVPVVMLLESELEVMKFVEKDEMFVPQLLHFPSPASRLSSTKVFIGEVGIWLSDGLIIL